MRIGYLHVGARESGINRYGSLLAQEASRRRSLTVTECVVPLSGSARDNEVALIEAARQLSEADVVHIQYNKQIWRPGWSQLRNVRAFLRHCSCPLVVTPHDVYVHDFDLPRAMMTVPGKLWRKIRTGAPAAPHRGRAKVGKTTDRVAPETGNGAVTSILSVGARFLAAVAANGLCFRLLRRRARLTFICTKEEANRVACLTGRTGTRVIPHFVEQRSVGVTPVEARRAVGLDPGRIITLLGFIVPRKGYELLLDALPMLPDDVTVVFAGGAPAGGRKYVDKLTQLVRAGGLQDRVRITGFLPDEELERYLLASDLAVCPFERLSASGSLSTWISVGKPILASDLPQMAEYNELEPGAIRTFRPYTPDALAKAIRTALEECDGGDAAVGRLRKRLSMPTVFDEHLRHYRAAAGRAVAETSTPQPSEQSGKPHAQTRATFLPQSDGNPYQKQLAAGLESLGVRVRGIGFTIFFFPLILSQGIPDILHLHWLQLFFRASNGLAAVVKLTSSLAALLALRVLGARLVWTVHNLKDHENPFPRLDRACTSFVVRLADGVIVHCETAKRQLMTEFNLRDDKGIHVIPHGHFMDSYDRQISRVDARDALGIPQGDTMFLFLGRVRPYKGVLELVEAFQKMNQPDARLVIAGKPLTAEAAELIRQRVAGCGRIKFVPGFVPDGEIQVYMNACDAAVMPYRDILTSGAAVLAMSFGKACIAPRLGCINDILDDRGAFLYDPHDTDGLLNALRSAAARSTDLERMGTHNQQVAAKWDWGRITRMTRDVYDQARTGRR